MTKMSPALIDVLLAMRVDNHVTLDPVLRRLETALDRLDRATGPDPRREHWLHVRSGSGPYERYPDVFRLSERSFDSPYVDNCHLVVDMVDKTVRAAVDGETLSAWQAPAMLQTECSIAGPEWCFLYRRLPDGHYWVRPVSEFLDGRFERVG